ncbi:zinc-finger-containing protein [Roseateles sp. DC23W]|uniref:Zinc-finger-containing protein n=1 Tax=Pelomonas dachongensis TaxID=3299029 RepID=A0ABW7EUV8_9BURK
MVAYRQGSDGQAGLGVFGEGNVVSLDGGKRIRMDDRVDFWPGNQAWQTIADGPDGPATGIGMTSLLTYLKRMRELAGRPVPSPPQRESDRDVVCNYCGQRAELHGGLAVYPDRKDLQDRQFWVCWACDAWVGCKSGGDEPFGDLANEELRAVRTSAHKAFDPVWSHGLMTKHEAYEWLSNALGIPRRECQIGRMKLEDCCRVSQIVWERFGQVAGDE